jgi:hypothetical protein
MTDDLRKIILKSRRLAVLAANIADRIDGHAVTVHRGQSVKVKSIEQPHKVDTLSAPQDAATIPVARLSSICRDFSQAIEAGLAALPRQMRDQLS